MNKRMLNISVLIVALILLLAACTPTQATQEAPAAPVEASAPTAVIEEEVAPEPTEATMVLEQTVALPHLNATMKFPAGWFAFTSEEGMTIADYEAQVGNWGTEPPVTGYSAESFVQPVEVLINDAGLPEGFGPQEFMGLIIGMFGAAEPTNVEELTVLGVPAVRMRSAIALDGESTPHPIDAVFAVTDDRAFFVVLHAPDEAMMDNISATWAAMVASISS